MKLLKSWNDSEYKVDNYLYENKYGLKILHTQNPNSLETYISIIVKAGSYYEKDLNVPSGTSHFLEHILVDGNSIFKSFKDIDKFCFGNKKRASISFDLTTNYKFVYIYGSTNSQRENDLIKLIYSFVSNQPSNFSKYFEKLKKIILAEMQNDKKPEKNPYLQLLKFALSEYSHNSNFSVIGESEDSIKSIKVLDLIKVFKHQYSPDNVIFTIQSPTKLSTKIIDYIDKISVSLAKNNKQTIKPVIEKVENIFDEGYFLNSEAKGVGISIFYFDKISYKRDYENDVLTNLASNLIRYIGFNELREKKTFGLFS